MHYVLILPRIVKALTNSLISLFSSISLPGKFKGDVSSLDWSLWEEGFIGSFVFVVKTGRLRPLYVEEIFNKFDFHLKYTVSHSHGYQ